MAFKIKFSLIAAGLLAVWIVLAGSQVFLPAGNSISMLSPSSCPPAGCAAGQRINFKVDFNLSVYDPASTRNVQVCIYAPIDWSYTAFEAGSQGGVSGASYFTGTSACDSTPANYDLLGGVTTTMPPGAFGDSILFNFRLGNTASAPGSVLVRVLEHSTANTWVRTSQIFNSLTVTGASSKVYVASDANGCLSNSPCYLNSGDDLTDGFGTGLKDAIDTSLSAITIQVLGDYAIKSSAILVDHPHTITGLNNAKINYTGGACTQPMLRLVGGATIRNLTIAPGVCSDANKRTLLQLENFTPVIIESNDLTGGLDAIHATSASTGSIAVRYNHIQGNSGYAVYLDPAGTSVLGAVANNILDNRPGAQVECSSSSRGTADHNYWGSISAGSALSKCTFTEARRLGAPALRITGAPGVSAQRVTASATQSYAFNNKIGFQSTLASGTASSFDLFIVNHGVGSSLNIPFTGSQAGGLTSCSNYWDVFLAETTPPPSGTGLSLSFKYDLSASCISTIESARFCNQTSPADPAGYPLYWYEVGADTWATTGRSPGGQTTSCNTTNREIQVTINDLGGRPSFTDLAHAPFVVGLPNQPAAVVFSSFTAKPGNQKAIIQWTTTSEINTGGFYVLRSEQADTGYVEVSTLIPHQGTSQVGSSYLYTDSLNLVNGRLYYYRLKVMNLDLSSIQTGSVSVTPIPETPTPTSTATITRSPAPTSIPPAATRTRTLYPTTVYVYRSNTPTRTPTATPTSPFQTITNTRTVTSSVTPTKVAGGGGPPLVIVTSEPGAATQLAQQRQTRTAQTSASFTPTLTSTPASGGEPVGNPLTLVLIIMAIVAATAGAAVYVFRGRLRWLG
jgi:hypothetical protein